MVTHDNIADNRKSTNETLDLAREGKIPEGLPCGIPKLDNHLRFKKAQFVIINGHDNVGKTDWILYYFLLLTLKHGLKWTILSAENKIYSLKRRLIEWMAGAKLSDLKEDKYLFYREHIDEYFKFIRNDERLSYRHVLNYSKDIESNGLLIDPYNSLVPDKGINRHEFDYEVCGEMRVHANRTGQSVYLNTHIASEFARKLYPKDHEYALNLMPPQKADTEGGQKFANRADDFMSIHRMTQHADRWNITEAYIRKVKDTDTGGRPTFMDQPVEFTRYSEINYRIDGKDPIHPKNDEVKPHENWLDDT